MFIQVPYYSKEFVDSVGGMAHDVGDNVWSYQHCFKSDVQKAFDRCYRLKDENVDMLIETETFTLTWFDGEVLVRDGVFSIVGKDASIISKGVVCVSMVDRYQAEKLISASERYQIKR